MHSGRGVWAVLRYRFRILWMRYSQTSPSATDVVFFFLAVAGAWSVLRVAASRITASTTTGMAIVGVGLLCLLWLGWRRVAHHPEVLFRLAAGTEARTAELQAMMAQGMAHDGSFELLRSLYEPLVDRIAASHNGQVDLPRDSDGSPALVVTIRPRMQQDLGSVLQGEPVRRSESWSRRVAQFAGERQMYMASLRRNANASSLFDDESGENIVVDHISVGDEISVRVSTATYGQIVRTSDALINEFALFAYLRSHTALRRRPNTLEIPTTALLRVLPWRRAVHSWDRGTALLLSPRGRAAGLGATMVLSVREGGKQMVLLGKRSARVGTYPDVWHVLPSGMVNYRLDSGDEESGARALPRLTMLSEFLEECFDVQEFSGHSLANFARRVERELSERGMDSAEPHFTGLALDLLNLRVEICAHLDLSEWPELLDDFLLSWEYTHTEGIRKVPLETGSRSMRRSEYVQAGVGAVHLASGVARRDGEDGA